MVPLQRVVAAVLPSSGINSSNGSSRCQQWQVAAVVVEDRLLAGEAAAVRRLALAVATAVVTAVQTTDSTGLIPMARRVTSSWSTICSLSASMRREIVTSQLLIASEISSWQWVLRCGISTTHGMSSCGCHQDHRRLSQARLTLEGARH